MTWRKGGKNPHTLYEHDEPVGMVIEPRDGERIVAAMNALDRIDELMKPSKLSTLEVLTGIRKALRVRKGSR